MRKIIVQAVLGLVTLTLTNHLFGATLTLSITNIPNSTGSIMVEILPSEAAFKKEAPAVASMILPARAPEVSLTLDALAEGEYGIRVMQDLNSDGKLNANMVGMPKEPWGFSNNATGAFGPPKWKGVKFQLEAVTEQTIQLNF